MHNKKISIIGSGNVATHLAINFKNKGYIIDKIISRNLKNAELLAQKVQASSSNNINTINDDSDIILVCVTDSALAEVVDSITFEPRLIAHTAGSVPIQVLQKFPNQGVFYPLQSFSKSVQLNISQVPFCIEANSYKNMNILQFLNPIQYLPISR